MPVEGICMAVKSFNFSPIDMKVNKQTKRRPSRTKEQQKEYNKMRAKKKQDSIRKYLLDNYPKAMEILDDTTINYPLINSVRQQLNKGYKITDKQAYFVVVAYEQYKKMELRGLM